MLTLSEDIHRIYALFVNDYNEEFEEATRKLSNKLNRVIKGIVLVDEKVKKSKNNKQIIGDSFSEIVCDYNDPVSLINALKPFRDLLLVVNASSERNQPFYQKLIPHIPYLLTPTESSLVWSTHKDEMRKMFESFDDTFSPQFLKIDKVSLDSSTQKLQNFDFPVISKPAGLAASILVKRANSYGELVKNINDTFLAIEAVYAKNRGRGNPSILIEEFIEGDMYSVDAYVDDKGTVYHLPPIKVTTAASIGLEGYYSYCNDSEHGLNKDEILGLNECATKAIWAVGLRNSAAHIEVFKTENGWKIIELGPRAGGYRQDMYKYAYGIDHAFNELLVKVGQKPETIPEVVGSCSIVNIYADAEGTITSIKGFDEALQLKGVVWLKLHAKVGDEALFCGNGGNFIIDGVIEGKDKNQTDATMKKIREMIKIEVV